MRFIPRASPSGRVAPSAPDANNLVGSITFAGSGTVNTWTGYQEIYAALPFDCTALFVDVSSVNAGATSTPPASASNLWELAVGSSGNEVPIYRFHTVTNATPRLAFSRLVPLSLPKGVRLAVRVASGNTSVASTAHRISAAPMPRSHHAPVGFRGVEMLNVSGGPDARVPSAFTIAANPGGLHEISAGIAQHWRAFAFHVATDNYDNAAVRSLVRVRWALHAGAGTGIVVAGYFFTGALARGAFPVMGPFPCDIPKGTRLQLHLTTSDATRTECGACLWGFY